MHTSLSGTGWFSKLIQSAAQRAYFKIHLSTGEEPEKESYLFRREHPQCTTIFSHSHAHFCKQGFPRKYQKKSLKTVLGPAPCLGDAQILRNRKHHTVWTGTCMYSIYHKNRSTRERWMLRRNRQETGGQWKWLVVTAAPGHRMSENYKGNMCQSKRWKNSPASPYVDNMGEKQQCSNIWDVIFLSLLRGGRGLSRVALIGLTIPKFAALKVCRSHYKCPVYNLDKTSGWDCCTWWL